MSEVEGVRAAWGNLLFVALHGAVGAYYIRPPSPC